MSKRTAIIPSMIILLLLAGCGGKGSTDTGKNPVVQSISPTKEKPIEAADVSVQSVISGYSLAVPEHEESKRIINNSFTVVSDRAYFLANLTDVCGASPDWSDRSVLASYDELRLWNIAAWEDSLYILAEDDAGAWFVLELDLNGAETHRWNLTQAGIADGMMPLSIAVSGVHAIVSGVGRLGVYKLDGDGISLVFSLSTQPSAAGMCVLPDGSVIVGQSMAGEYSVSILDTDSRELRSINSFDMLFARMSVGISWDLYLDDGDGVYGLRFSDGSFEKLFTWSGLGITGGKICELSDGRLLCSGSLDSFEPSPLLTINNFIVADGEYEPHTLILATADRDAMGSSLRGAILEWNREHPECVVEIRDYSVYYDGEDQRAAELKMAVEQTLGNFPDIYDFSTPWDGAPLPAVSYSYKGLLEDLYPYIDGDDELSRSDFLSGVLTSMETEGGLYELVLSYRMLTSYYRFQDTGDLSICTYEQLQELVDGCNFYTAVMDSLGSRAEYLQTVLGASGEKLLDRGKAECYFDSGYFVNVLKTARDMREDSYGYFDPGDYPRNTSTGLLYFEDLQRIDNVIYDEGWIEAGIPELGNVVWPNSSMGISAYSEYKDECWEFLRFLLLKSREDAGTYDFSMLRDVMESELKKALRWVEENGYAERIPPMEAAMSDMLTELERISAAYRHDEALWEIVWGEAQKFFAGTCTAEEAAEHIQSKAMLYIAEQYG